MKQNLTMFVTKPKKYHIRRYACYHCSCTGFRPIKRHFFKIFNWEIKIKKKEICYSCSGRGFVNSYQIIGAENDYRSYLNH